MKIYVKYMNRMDIKIDRRIDRRMDRKIDKSNLEDL